MTTLINDDTSLGKILLAEYEHLKKEQIVRIKYRDYLLYANLVAAAAVIAATVRDTSNYQHPQVSFLLLLPVVSVILGWNYVVNDEKVSAIGRYLRSEVVQRLSALAGGVPVLGWEETHRGDSRRRSRKVIQLVIDILAFCGIPLAALGVFWSTGPVGFLVVLSSVELVAVLGLVSQIIVYADFTSDV